MGQYKTGYVDVTKGSNVVYGYGTSWDGEIDPGDLFSIDGERAIYVVDSVVGSTCLTLTGNYCGSSKTKRTYTITRSFTTNLFLPRVERRDVYWPKYLSYAINILDKGEARGCDSLLDGLVLYFPFHESSLISDSTFYDVSPMGNNGTIVGATWTSEGMSFDGEDDYVDVGDKSSLEFPSGKSFSLTYWFKGTDHSEMSDGIIAKGYGGGDYDLKPWYMVYYRTTGRVGLFLRDSSGTDYDSSTNGPVIDDGNWHFLAHVYDAENGEIRNYLDGELDADSVVTGVPNDSYGTNSGKFVLMDHNQRYTQGTITGVRIYNRALSAEEVNRLYQLGRSYTGLPETGTVYVIDNKLYFRVVDTWHQVALT